MAVTIETFGLSCPQPVILVKKAIDENKFPITVLIDSEVVLENVSRLVKRMGLSFSRSYGDGLVSLVISS